MGGEGVGEVGFAGRGGIHGNLGGLPVGIDGGFFPSGGEDDIP